MGATLIGPGGEIDVSDDEARELGQVTVKNPTADPETGLAKEDTLAELRDRTPPEAGTSWYAAGTGGSFVVDAGRRILGISAYAHSADGSFDVDGGDGIQVRSGVGREWNPRGNLAGPLTITFDASLDWIVEGVE